jgi:response regulator RpfG family c-di-GMP phosphodiesterase
MTEPSFTLSQVLLVDDEENILKSVSRLLMDDEDLMVLTASSGEEGLKLISANPGIALILSDQRMPGMSGAEFLEKSRAIIPGAVRMVLTGYADINATMDAINKGGAARYITKPWDDSMLVQTIRDGVRQFRLQQENLRLTNLVQQQNLELQEWNNNLKKKVLEQTATIRKQLEDLSGKNVCIKRSFTQSIGVFSRLVELIGRRQQNHARNVAEITVGIAKDLALSEDDVERIQTAALLHDIGEIGIPDVVLDMKLSMMGKEERRIYLQHAVRGQTAIDTVEELRDVGKIIRHHHEYFDGKGYPDGLAGEKIPLGSRIIAIADFIDREMSDQSGEIALEGVLSKVQSLQGMQFDPTLVKHARRYARYLYFTLGNGQREGVEYEYHPNELSPGLELTRNVFSGTGVLLLGKGTVLDQQQIDSIQYFYLNDPPTQGVFAVAQREKK